MKRKRNLSIYVKTLCFLLLSLAVLFPVLYSFANSFMGQKEITEAYSGILGIGADVGFHMFPEHFTLEAYGKVMLDTPEYWMKFWKSLGMAGLIAIGQLLIGGHVRHGFYQVSFSGMEDFLLSLRHLSSTAGTGDSVSKFPGPFLAEADWDLVGPDLTGDFFSLWSISHDPDLPERSHGDTGGGQTGRGWDSADFCKYHAAGGKAGSYQPADPGFCRQLEHGGTAYDPPAVSLAVSSVRLPGQCEYTKRCFAVCLRYPEPCAGDPSLPVFS